MARHFGAIVGPSLQARDEAKSLTIARALEGLPHARRPVMVGDRKFDVLGARAHELPCIGVLWGIGSEQELRDAGAAALASAPAELPALLGAWSARGADRDRAAQPVPLGLLRARGRRARRAARDEPARAPARRDDAAGLARRRRAGWRRDADGLDDGARPTWLGSCARARRAPRRGAAAAAACAPWPGSPP